MDKIRSTFRNISDSVMNVSNEERLVREATTMDKWGPTAQQMKAICDLTFQHASFRPVMNALMQRLSEPGKYWRHVYKALLVIDYALKNGSPEVAEYCRHHIIEIQTLQRYQHIDEDNRDQGLNVRERAKIVLELINDEKKLDEERKRAYACRDKYVGVSNDGSAAGFGGARYSSRSGSSRYGSVSYEDSSVPSRSRGDEDRWGIGDSAGDDSALPEPEPLPEPVAEEPKAQQTTNFFDADFSSEPAAAAKPAQTGSLFDSLDMTTGQQPAPGTTGSFFDAPAPSQQSPAKTTSFFDSPAAAPAPAASNNTMSFFDMPASQPAQPAAAAKPKTDPMSFFDMPASQPMQPTTPAASNNTMSFFDMPASQPATTSSSSSSAFSFTSSSSTTAQAQPASSGKDDMWGGLVNLDSLGSTSSSSTTPKSSGPMAGPQGSTAMNSSSKPMASMNSTGPAMRPMGSSMGSTMSFTSTTTQPLQPTTGPNYDALRQPQYNAYAMQQQQQMYRMQQMQQQQRYGGF